MVPNCVPVNEVAQDKDIKDKEGSQPAKNYAGDMAKSTKDKRSAHFAKKKVGPAPGDASAKTKPSKHTKKYKQMFGEAIEGLKNKAEKTGMPYSILKQVYDRGMAAWKGGHGLVLLHNNGHLRELIVSLQRVKEHGVVRIKI